MLHLRNRDVNKKASGSGFTLSTQVVVIASIAWAVIALLFFLLFSVPIPGEGRPSWYTPVTYVLENIALIWASLLCFRNWRSSQIVSGRTVWLLFSLGIFSYFIGNLILAQWELGWGKTPDVSPADLFFLLTYVLLGIGMGLAVASRKLSLSAVQWLILGLILILGIVVAYFVGFAPEGATEVPPPVLEQAAPAALPTEAPAAIAPEAPDTSAAPGWAIALEQQLEPFSDFVLKLYIIGDIILVVMATMLLLAFWGGKSSLPWRFIAAAAFSFYIADLWLFYALKYISDYETGALLEVFWIFSGCLFAIGAALEYDFSTRSRRGSRRRV